MTTRTDRSIRSPLRTRLLAIALGLAAATGAGSVAAQDYVFGWNPRSGDVWVDNTLGDMNRYGSRYRDPFVDELVRYHGAPRDLVTDLLNTRRWAPGDVYYACALASALGRPCRYVADYWERNHGKGWGVVAQELGIKPGSAEFHRLKRGFVPTYDRWSRPITLDADLRDDFPGRGNGGNRGGKPVTAGAGKGKPVSAGPTAGKGKATSTGPAAGKGKPTTSPASGKGKPATTGGKAQGQGKGNKGNGKG
ncbi:hypothetical protein [Cognatilysobacter tabacisoli]|uniref:hypothetical protein n=1 Tax=Cognatilysobacter tabacisoli TaxID=2315424 RepID=UPI000E6AED92|nr:hypothetical protein [Lysobacter tabacisoli]